MSSRRSPSFSSAVMSLSLAAAAALSATSALAGDARVKSMMRPGAGVSFDIGSQHAMAYFVPNNGVCNLTMVMAPILGEDELPSTAGTRINASIEGGKRARIDTAEGKSVELICAPAATMVSLRRVEFVAHAASRPRS